MPFFMRNPRSCGSHLLLRALRRRHGHTHIIPTNFEWVLVMQVGRVLFLDSMQFTDTLNDEDFVETKKKVWEKIGRAFSSLSYGERICCMFQIM